VRICFLDFSLKLESLDELKKTGRGGMVSSLFKVPDALSKLNNEVDVLSDIQNPGTTEAGTRFVNQPEGAYDALVLNRGMHDGYPMIRARHRVLWTHDVPHSGFIPDPRSAAALSLTIFMSRYAEKVWRFCYPEIGKSVQIPNAVDKTLFFPREKDLNSIVFFSHPNRGLQRLPLIFAGVRGKTGRPLTLDAFSSCYKNEPGGQEYIDLFNENMTCVKPEGLVRHEFVPHHELAEKVGRAGLMVMPTDLPETCSNSVLQALASGTPVVSTGYIGSVKEFVNEKNGYLTENIPANFGSIYSVEIARAMISILIDEKKHRKMIKAAARTKILTWEEVGASWNKALLRLS
jgi:glycosyltransferase involved in cell wall biosynthesis